MLHAFQTAYDRWVVAHRVSASATKANVSAAIADTPPPCTAAQLASLRSVEDDCFEQMMKVARETADAIYRRGAATASSLPVGRRR